MRVHKGAALAAGAAALALVLVGCSSSGSHSSKSSSSTGDNTSKGTTLSATGAFASCNASPNTCNSGTAKSGGTITYAIEKQIAGWNLNTGNSNTFEDAEVEDGILPTVFNAGPDFKPFLNTDMMTSATSTTTGGVQTVTYKIKPSAVWSDGQPIDFSDFKYLADASNPSTCKDCAVASSSGYTNITSMTSADNGKTVVVKMKPFSDWQSMFGALLPAHIAEKEGGVSGNTELTKSFTWFDQHVPTFSGGPMIIQSYAKNTSVTEAPNPKYYGTKSKVTSVIFKEILDQTQEPPALQNHEVDAIYPQPTQAIVNATKNLQGIQSQLGLGLQWEHLDMNTKNQFLSDISLREAIATAINVKGLIQRTVGLFASGIKPLGNHMYVPGQPGYTDNVTSTGQGSGDLAKAKAYLTKAGYTGVGSTLKTKAGKTVTLSCLYTQGNTIRNTECTLVQSALKSLGINVTLKTTADLHELASGQFDLVIFAWVNTPFVSAGAQQIWTKAGGSDFASCYDNTATADINSAVAASSTAEVQKDLNAADKSITAQACVLPLYQKPSYLAASTNVVNIRNNATSVGPPYNVGEWGLKS